MAENELKEKVRGAKDFLTDDQKDDMYMELNKKYKDLMGGIVQYVADMLNLQIDEKGGVTCKGYELARFLMLMNVACDCEIKALEKFKRQMGRHIEEQLSKAADKDLNRKLS